MLKHKKFSQQLKQGNLGDKEIQKNLNSNYCFYNNTKSIIKKQISLLIIAIFLTSCAAQKVVYVPTEAKTTIEYRDTTIILRDTIRVPIPVEEKQNMTKRDSSHLETSVATSDAWIDEENNLNHRLTNKKAELKAKVDTCFVVQYVDKIIEREVINEVEVNVPYIPKIAWICIILTCCWIVLKIARIIWKLKSGGL